VTAHTRHGRGVVRTTPRPYRRDAFYWQRLNSQRLSQHWLVAVQRWRRRMHMAWRQVPSLAQTPEQQWLP